MRKCLMVSLISLLLLFHITGFAFAADAAGVDIPVVIDGGGTAYLIPNINCPLPTESNIHVDNGRTGRFHIDFTEVGEYRYKITAGFSAPGGEEPAEEYFTVTVTVAARPDGSLYTVIRISSSCKEGKLEHAWFRKTTAPTQPSGTPGTTAGPGRPGSPDTPNTGDESHLTGYLTIAIAAAAALFGLALVYAVNTKKLIQGK